MEKLNVAIADDNERMKKIKNWRWSAKHITEKKSVIS